MSNSTFSLQLIRKDVVVSSLPEVVDNMILGDPQFVRETFCDTINDVKVQYVKRVEVTEE